jgi:hypothetical protein
MNYTLIAHKSSGSTSCRGCIMDQWDSDFELYYSSNATDVINTAVPYILINMKDEELGHYEVTILYNGFPIDYQDDDTIDLYKAACNIARQQADDYKAAKERKRIDAEQAEKDRKKENDLKLLAKLKEQYGE